LKYKTTSLPVLDRIRESKRRERNSLTRLDKTTSKKRSVFTIRQAHSKEIMKKKEIGRNSNIDFAKMSESRKKKNPVRGQMVNLNPIGLKKFKKKVGRGITEPCPHKRDKKNRLIGGRRWNLVLTRPREIGERLSLKEPVGDKQI